MIIYNNPVGRLFFIKSNVDITTYCNCCEVFCYIILLGCIQTKFNHTFILLNPDMHFQLLFAPIEYILSLFIFCILQNQIHLQSYFQTSS